MSDKENQDNQNWLDLLGGKSVPNAAPDTVLEAQALRTILLERATQESEIPYPQVLKKTLESLEAEGYLKPPVEVSKLPQSNKTKVKTEICRGKPTCLPLRNWFNFITSEGRHYQYAFAAMLIAVLILPLFLYDDSVLTRKEPSGELLDAFIPKSTKPAYPNKKSYPEPEIEAVNLKTQLENLEIAVKLTHDGETWRIEATLPAEKSPALQALLKHYQLIMPPGDNRLRVDISKMQP